MTEIKGYHVLGAFVLAFGVIIAVNLTLAFNAVRTFPGLEVKNSYVASQSFDADRAAQQALGWRVASWLDGDVVHLEVLENGRPIAPQIDHAIFGRATSVMADQAVQFSFNGRTLTAPVTAGPGNWNLRIKATAFNGTEFRQRIVVRAKP